MTRPNALVVDGNEIKLRLEAERKFSNEVVHVDWVRFTANIKNAPFPDAETLFPTRKEWAIEYADVPNPPAGRLTRLMNLLRELPDEDFMPAAQAREMASHVASILGSEFDVFPELRKGHDFYKSRWSIVRNEVEVGWVGFGASGDSPRQKAQASTLHCNLYGASCTFADQGWRQKLADYIDSVQGKITRVDLALDFFHGISGGLKRILSDYESGLMVVYGKNPKCNMVGAWHEGGRGRSFYFGSKETGKQTNVYEKGVQLFGEKDATNWERIEIRYGNKLRDLSTDTLRRPTDFFAGASDWHKTMLLEHGVTEFTAEPIKTRSKLVEETVSAEVTRVYRWLKNTAAPAITFAFEHLNDEQMSEIVFNNKLPGRLQRFTKSDLKDGVLKAFQRFTAPRVRAPGFDAALAH